MRSKLVGALLACAVCSAAAPAEAQRGLTPPGGVSAPRDAKRAASARPTIEGVWAANFILLMEATPRTPNLIVSEPEAKAIAAGAAAVISDILDKLLDPEAPTAIRSTDGLPIVRGQRRTRLVVEPSNGKLPYTAEARKEIEAELQNPPADNPEQRPSGERCLGMEGPPPLTTFVFFGGPFQILRTRDDVVLRTEGGVRIVRLSATHGPSELSPRLGDSIGHWEGETLVIETTGLPDADRRLHILPSFLVPGEAKVIERLTPISERELLYQFTIIDPKTYAAPWLAEFSWFRTDKAMFEYACHEGNYSLPNILSGSRHEEAAKTIAGPATR